jgi:hypothetical protein
MPTITATGFYVSEVIVMQGNRIRYVQTIGGTGSPSFTRAINRLQSSNAHYSQATPGALIDGSGTTSASPSTSTQIFAANQGRKYLLVQNLGATAIYINFTNAASATNSIYLAPNGGSFVQETNFVSTEAINVLSTGTSVAYMAKQG